MATSTNGGWVDGKLGVGLDFDGSDDYVGFSNFSLTEFAVAGWVKADSFSTLWVIPFGEYNTNNDFIGQKNSGLWRTSFSDGSTADFTGAVISTGQWQYWTITYDGSIVKYYLDGNFQGSASASSKTLNINNLGVPFSSAGYEFDGSLDDVRIYNRALSADEVTRLYNMGR